MRLLSLVTVLCLVSGAALAYQQTDPQCVNSCIQRGGTYSQCHPMCTREVQIPGSRGGFSSNLPTGPDYRCVLECEQMGGGQNYCRRMCAR
jgi:hypothetical protein